MPPAPVSPAPSETHPSAPPSGEPGRATPGPIADPDPADHAGRGEPNWPPYDIEKLGESEYRITMAVAGFAPDEIELVQKENSLLVAGQKHGSEEGRQYLHRGIAARAFKQTFNLADHVKVSGAKLENGLLTIELVREVPEAMKPRRIAIGTSNAAPQTISQDNQKQPTEQEQVRAA